MGVAVFAGLLLLIPAAAMQFTASLLVWAELAVGVFR